MRKSHGHKGMTRIMTKIWKYVFGQRTMHGWLHGQQGGKSFTWFLKMQMKPSSMLLMRLTNSATGKRQSSLWLNKYTMYHVEKSPRQEKINTKSQKCPSMNYVSYYLDKKYLLHGDYIIQSFIPWWLLTGWANITVGLFICLSLLMLGTAMEHFLWTRQTSTDRWVSMWDIITIWQSLSQMEWCCLNCIHQITIVLLYVQNANQIELGVGRTDNLLYTQHYYCLLSIM